MGYALKYAQKSTRKIMLFFRVMGMGTIRFIRNIKKNQHLTNKKEIALFSINYGPDSIFIKFANLPHLCKSPGKKKKKMLPKREMSQDCAQNLQTVF